MEYLHLSVKKPKQKKELCLKSELHEINLCMIIRFLSHIYKKRSILCFKIQTLIIINSILSWNNNNHNNIRKLYYYYYYECVSI